MGFPMKVNGSTVNDMAMVYKDFPVGPVMRANGHWTKLMGMEHSYMSTGRSTLVNGGMTRRVAIVKLNQKFKLDLKKALKMFSDEAGSVIK